jgi:hypothetical protein
MLTIKEVAGNVLIWFFRFPAGKNVETNPLVGCAEQRRVRLVVVPLPDGMPRPTHTCHPSSSPHPPPLSLSLSPYWHAPSQVLLGELEHGLALAHGALEQRQVHEPLRALHLPEEPRH